MKNDKDKSGALKLLIQKQSDPHITYQEITEKTGYSKRQLIRLAGELNEKDMQSILVHGNTGKKPVTTASDQEVSYLEEFKKAYPSITIAQFRDIYREDVIWGRDPERKGDAAKYGLKDRSKSWFRDLFVREGWKSPSAKPIRTDGSHVSHPIRRPRDRRGELIQIDGTPYDWFNDGRAYALHLAVDDAGTEVLAGWFMPTECTRGYARMMRLILEKYGVPMATYSDKDSVFRSVKSGKPSQFADMFARLDIKMIFANSPQAKGRVERYNGTAQGRLPNDIIRFHIPHNYNTLNRWFNEKYIRYLNAKFSFPVLDPVDAFRPLPTDFDYSAVFYAEYPRTMRNNMFSMGNSLYEAFDADGVMLEIYQKTPITVKIDAFTEEMYINRYGKHYKCEKVGERRRDPIYEADSQKDVQRILSVLEDHRK
jgi:hypothetical protein